jgi:hypothetical protein
MNIPFLDFTVPTGQYVKEANKIGSDVVFENISLNDATKKYHDLVVITDQALPYFPEVNAQKKIIWIIEPPSIHPHLYQQAHYFKDEAALIFTHTKDFIRQFPDNSRYCPWGSYFIKVEDHKIYDKSKNTTIIASSKSFAPGHRMRHEVIQRYENLFDYVRKGGTDHSKYQNTGDEYKLNFIKDYRFSVEIENASIDGYFTEKILDCFRTGTIPVYCGDPSIFDNFDSGGIITFSNVSELESILPTLNKDLYEQKFNSVRNNFEKAEQFLYPWKHVWENGINELL